MKRSTPWQPYTPSSKNPWTARLAGHLLRRVGFGPTATELEQVIQEGPTATLDRLLNHQQEQAELEQRFAFLTTPRSLPRDANNTELASRWLLRMLEGTQTLHEKLCLFWHNHFATSNVKVQNARYMLAQYELIRKHALGRFDELLQEMTFDPAMMVWLDTVGSVKGKPNENYARELMELFSLGIGNYTEADIREAARAFTGYELVNGKIVFNERQHDDGEKTVFGRRGRWQPKDIVQLCLDRPECAEFIVGKLYRFFFSDIHQPTAEQIQSAAIVFRESKYDIKQVVSLMLRSEEFFAPTMVQSKIKSPVEFAVSIVRGLGGRAGALTLANRIETLGQQLFAPPSVKGWDGGSAWLNAQTLLLRGNLASALTNGKEADFGTNCDPVQFFKQAKANTAQARVQLLLHQFFQGEIRSEVESQLMDYATKHTDTDGQRALAHLVLSLPEFQLC